MRPFANGSCAPQSCAGDVIEQLQQSRLARYNAAKSILDAELAAREMDSRMVGSLAGRRVTRRSFYVWSSGRTLSIARKRQRGFARACQIASHTNTLLLSLDAAQLDAYRKDPARLRAALDTAHRRGIRIELLLGEPTWLLPAQRRGYWRSCVTCAHCLSTDCTWTSSRISWLKAQKQQALWTAVARHGARRAGEQPLAARCQPASALSRLACRSSPHRPASDRQRRGCHVDDLRREP